MSKHSFFVVHCSAKFASKVHESIDFNIKNKLENLKMK